MCRLQTESISKYYKFLLILILFEITEIYMSLLDTEIEEVSQYCENVVDHSKLVACTRSLVSVFHSFVFAIAT